MATTPKYKPPKPSKADAAHAVARAGLGTIPVAGAAAGELLSAIVTPSLERRRDAWMEEVGEGLREIERNMGVVLEELSNNEVFTNIALEAASCAIRTSSDEKRRALKNALINAALPNPFDEFQQRLFLTYIDTLTEWHIKLLALFDGPSEYMAKSGLSFGGILMGSLFQVITTAFPELRSKKNICDSIWKDLYSKGLVNTEILHVIMTVEGVVARRTTSIARDFIRFIQSPIENDV